MPDTTLEEELGARSLRTMQRKALRILALIQAAQAPLVIAAPLTPVEATWAGTAKAIPNATNTSPTIRGFGGVPVMLGDSSWTLQTVSNGYNRDASRGSMWATRFDGELLRVVGRQYGNGTATGQNHRLMVNRQWVTIRR